MSALKPVSCCRQIFPPEDKIESINDTYWTIRAEPDEDEDEAGAAPSSLIHVYHYHADAQNHVCALPHHNAPLAPQYH